MKVKVGRGRARPGGDSKGCGSLTQDHPIVEELAALKTAEDGPDVQGRAHCAPAARLPPTERSRYLGRKASPGP
jgi:hypothetical protein